MGVRIDSRAGVVAVSLLAFVALFLVALLVVRPLVSSSRVERAVEVLPDSVSRVSYTDWAQVREGADGGPVSSTGSQRDLEAFLDRAFEQDLTVTSSLTSSFPALAAAYGITPLDAEWEVYGQGPEGAVALLRLADDVDLEEVEARFDELGYQAPSGGAGKGGTWVGTPELVAGLERPLSPLQENLAVLPDEHLLVMADDPGFVDTAVAAIEGEEARLESVEGLGNLVGEVDDPVTATVWVDDFACEDLAMSQAAPEDAAEGRTLVEEAGGVHPLEGLIFAQRADGTLVFVLGFSGDEAAEDDLQPRTDLASGPAPGQGGSFGERFELTSSTSNGSLVTMRARPVAERVLLDIGQGPVLFATC